jgi:hypothetical protein
MALTVLGPIANSHERSTSENPTSLDIELSRVVVCGFPRTGTTFLQTAIQDVFEDSTACWKNHDVLGIPRYLKAGIPTVVTLREPLDTAVSWSIYNQDRVDADLLAHRLNTYAIWHEQVLHYLHSRLLRLKRFDDFREHPFETMSPVLQQIAREEELHHVDAEFVQNDLERKNLEQGLLISRANLPSGERHEQRQRYLELAQCRPAAKALDRASSIYDELHIRSLNRPSLDMLALAVTEQSSFRASNPAVWAGAIATGSAGAASILRLLGD